MVSGSHLFSVFKEFFVCSVLRTVPRLFMSGPCSPVWKALVCGQGEGDQEEGEEKEEEEEEEVEAVSAQLLFMMFLRACFPYSVCRFDSGHTSCVSGSLWYRTVFPCAPRIRQSLAWCLGRLRSMRYWIIREMTFSASGSSVETRSRVSLRSFMLNFTHF